MKRFISLFSLVVFIFILCSCGKNPNGEVSFTPTEDTHDYNQTIDHISAFQNTDVVLQDKLVYSNLDSKSSMNEVRDILINSGIQSNHVNMVFNWVTDYNNSMRECSSFSLEGDFVALNEMVVDYGEYYPMSAQWFKRNNRNYHDVVCRIVAYELNQDNISVGNVIKKENFDCWDENTAWLYTDGDILFGREAVEGEHKAYIPFPLIDWSKDMQAKYFTLFNPIYITEQCSEQEMFQAIQEKWNEQEISFKENAVSLVTFWTQSGDRMCASHAAILIEACDGYLLFEKTNPESPYAATKFSSTDEVKQYLYNMMDLEYSRYDDKVGTYIILQNDKLLSCNISKGAGKYTTTSSLSGKKLKQGGGAGIDYLAANGTPRQGNLLTVSLLFFFYYWYNLFIQHSFVHNCHLFQSVFENSFPRSALLTLRIIHPKFSLKPIQTELFLYIRIIIPNTIQNTSCSR